jgi:hypothetical protein
MPRKKSLGRDLDKSLELMDKLSGLLYDFTNMPLKKGLHTNRISDEKLVKVINEASEKALSLKNGIEDIKDQIKVMKPPKNSRFASRVVKRFIENNNFLIKS